MNKQIEAMLDEYHDAIIYGDLASVGAIKRAYEDVIDKWDVMLWEKKNKKELHW